MLGEVQGCSGDEPLPAGDRPWREGSFLSADVGALLHGAPGEGPIQRCVLLEDGLLDWAVPPCSAVRLPCALAKRGGAMQVFGENVPEEDERGLFLEAGRYLRQVCVRLRCAAESCSQLDRRLPRDGSSHGLSRADVRINQVGRAVEAEIRAGRGPTRGRLAEACRGRSHAEVMEEALEHCMHGEASAGLENGGGRRAGAEPLASREGTLLLLCRCAIAAAAQRCCA
jgi:hypothetical protein